MIKRAYEQRGGTAEEEEDNGIGYPHTDCGLFSPHCTSKQGSHKCKFSIKIRKLSNYELVRRPKGESMTVL